MPRYACSTCLCIPCECLKREVESDLAEARLAIFADAEKALRGIVHTCRFRDDTETGESYAEVSRWSYDAARDVLARIDALEPKGEQHDG